MKATSIVYDSCYYLMLRRQKWAGADDDDDNDDNRNHNDDDEVDKLYEVCFLHNTRTSF